MAIADPHVRDLSPTVQALTPMKVGRAYGAAAAVGGKLLVAGGMASENQNDTIEVFDPSRYTWDDVALPDENWQRAFLTACVLPST